MTDYQSIIDKNFKYAHMRTKMELAAIFWGDCDDSVSADSRNLIDGSKNYLCN